MVESVLYLKQKGRQTVEKYKLDRINELAHKSKAEGLTAEEKEEQKILRQEFLAEIRADVKASLESIEIVEEVEESVVLKDDLLS
jgi:uncharacterized protein YnzC (UPF0291/DUF896 family)